MALAPDFEKSHRIYFSFFETLPKGNSNTYLAHGVLDEAGNAVHDVTVIYRGVPELPEQNFSMKQGGRIVFAKDGSLFMTVGDRDGNKKADYDQQLAQKLDNDVGKIIHLTAGRLAGAGQSLPEPPRCAPGNLGLWHPQPRRICASPPDGTLWETEHGPRGGDELNASRRARITAGPSSPMASTIRRADRSTARPPRRAWSSRSITGTR